MNGLILYKGRLIIELWLVSSSGLFALKRLAISRVLGACRNLIFVNQRFYFAPLVCGRRLWPFKCTLSVSSETVLGGTVYYAVKLSWLHLMKA